MYKVLKIKYNRIEQIKRPKAWKKLVLFGWYY